MVNIGDLKDLIDTEGKQFLCEQPCLLNTSGVILFLSKAYNKERQVLHEVNLV